MADRKWNGLGMMISSGIEDIALVFSWTGVLRWEVSVGALSVVLVGGAID